MVSAQEGLRALKVSDLTHGCLERGDAVGDDGSVELGRQSGQKMAEQEGSEVDLGREGLSHKFLKPNDERHDTRPVKRLFC